MSDKTEKDSVSDLLSKVLNPPKVNPEYLALVPRPTPEEYKALELDIIERKGAFEPIVVNRNNEILDGHTRFEICTKYSLRYDTRIMDFSNVADEKIFAISANVKRRHLTDQQKIDVAKSLEDLYAEQAGLREIEAGKLGRDIQLGVASIDATPVLKNKGRTSKKIADIIGVSFGTYERGKKVRDEGNEEERIKSNSKKHGVYGAYRQLMKRLRNEKLSEEGPAPLPEGKFDVIYADPPWDYDFKLRGAPDEHYPVMSDQAICDLVFPISEDAILFLWATKPRIESAFKVVKAWGFEYKTLLVWIKDKIGTGYYFRAQVELLLVATKGNFSPPPEEVRRSDVLQATRTEHSRKPEEVYEIIESYYPKHKYLELFSRNKRDGWTMWGYNESSESPSKSTEN